jgi:hypothetical protein
VHRWTTRCRPSPTSGTSISPPPCSASRTGRFVCELAPDDLDWFLDGLGAPATVLGTVTAEPVLRLGPIAVPTKQLHDAFTGGQR